VRKPTIEPQTLNAQMRSMNTTRNTLRPTVRQKSISVLNTVVADLLDLFARIKQAHWNVRGTTFIGLHKLLDEFGDRVLDQMDSVAERATALGGVVHGTLRQSAKASTLKRKEEPVSIHNMNAWLNELADVHAAAGKDVHEFIKATTDLEDFATADLLTGLLRDLDLQLWLLEAHLTQSKLIK
jgi:starvation-inducible DNA-binding protein